MGILLFYTKYWKKKLKTLEKTKENPGKTFGNPENKPWENSRKILGKLCKNIKNPCLTLEKPLGTT
jgi:hypothetical protein